MIEQSALDDLKARNPCDAYAGTLVRLRRHGKSFIGPCPLCSQNRQSPRATKFQVWPDHWACASGCGGGDIIALLQKVEGVDFKTAIERLGGVRAIDAKAAAEGAAKRQAERERADRQNNEFRNAERKRLFDMWTHENARDLPGSSAEAYLKLRRLDVLPQGLKLRCIEGMPYFATGKRDDVDVIHRGPAMLAPIIGLDGKFAGLHFTYIDLDKPKGKAALIDPNSGAELPAKKVRGSKTGGHIALVDAAEPHTLVIGEGIEKVLAVWRALLGVDRDLAGWSFWTSVDLGNLGGKAEGAIAHPTLKSQAGRAQRVPGPYIAPGTSGIPIPAGVRRLYILGDGGSDPFTTQCAVARAGARFAWSDRTVACAWSPAGADFDEMLPEAA